MKGLKLYKSFGKEQTNRINKSIIYNYVREKVSVSRNQISKDLNLSGSTVSRVIDIFIKEGYVNEVGKLESKKGVGGKRASQLKLNSNKGFVIGIDLGGDKFRANITNFNGEEINTYKGFELEDSTDIISKLIKEINTIIKDSKINNKNIKAICIGMPAHINVETGEVLGASTYNNWIGLNFKDSILKETNIPVYIENVTNLSTIGEKNYGQGKEYENIVYIRMGENRKAIAAGIIIDDFLFRGSNGLAGEIGFSLAGIENLNYKGKNIGFFESLVSFESIKEKISNLAKNRKKTTVIENKKNINKNFNISEFFNSSLKGDNFAKEIITEIVQYFSILMINLILINDPQIIILGGGFNNIDNSEEIFIKPLIKTISKIVPSELPKIKISSLGDKAAIKGASFMAIETYLIGKFPYTLDSNAGVQSGA